MALYAMADRTSNITSANACFEIRTTTTDRAFVRRISISLVTAAATVIGIGRPAAIGVTPTSPKTVLAWDTGNPAGTVTTAVAWGTGPTVPANFLERYSFPATIGSGVIIPFDPPGLVIPVSSSIVLWNILGGATLDVTVVEEE
jgi:hypothetical protein